MRVLMSFLFLFFSSQLHAMEMDFPIERLKIFSGESVDKNPKNKKAHSHGCKNLKFNTDQKKGFTEIKQVFATETREIRDKYQRMRKKYFQELRDPSISQKVISLREKGLRALEEELINYRTDLFHFLVFELAKTSQRRALLRCLNHMRHHVRLRTLRESEKKTPPLP